MWTAAPIPPCCILEICTFEVPAKRLYLNASHLYLFPYANNEMQKLFADNWTVPQFTVDGVEIGIATDYVRQIEERLRGSRCAAAAEAVGVPTQAESTDPETGEVVTDDVLAREAETLVDSDFEFDVGIPTDPVERSNVQIAHRMFLHERATRRLLRASRLHDLQQANRVWQQQQNCATAPAAAAPVAS